MKTLAEVFQDWEAVIGLEVHTELTTLNSKMFCSCKVEYGAPPNTHVCPACLGMPGSLPVPNKAAIESIVLAGLATGCDIEKQTMFYRKNYVYPDMSRNYQITQGPVAFCMRGELDLEVRGASAAERTHREGTRPLMDDEGAHATADKESQKATEALPEGYATTIGITRIHMEEDAGKLVHVGGESGRISGAEYSLVDYNRCATPLIELVTEPDLRTPEEARLFLQNLRAIYLTLQISDCSMEQGSLRCDGNVSLRKRGTTEFGTKTELKNMNSFKNLHDGLAYEICRQAEVLESGGTVVQETRHWEPASRRTISMRLKETADDYRYFPDPDLSPFNLSDEFIEAVRAKLPELPDARAKRYQSEFMLPAADARNIAQDVDMARYLDAALAASGDGRKYAKPLANLLLNDVSAYLNAEALTLEQTKLTPAYLAELARLIADDEVSSKQGKELLAEVFAKGISPIELVDSMGIRQVSDVEALEQVAQQILADNPDKVAEYKNGKEGLIGFFVGQAMKATGGNANPKLLNETFQRLLSV